MTQQEIEEMKKRPREILTVIALGVLTFANLFNKTPENSTTAVISLFAILLLFFTLFITKGKKIIKEIEKISVILLFFVIALCFVSAFFFYSTTNQARQIFDQKIGGFLNEQTFWSVVGFYTVIVTVLVLWSIKLFLEEMLAKRATEVS